MKRRDETEGVGVIVLVFTCVDVDGPVVAYARACLPWFYILPNGGAGATAKTATARSDTPYDVSCAAVDDGQVERRRLWALASFLPAHVTCAHQWSFPFSKFTS